MNCVDTIPSKNNAQNTAGTEVTHRSRDIAAVNAMTPPPWATLAITLIAMNESLRRAAPANARTIGAATTNITSTFMARDDKGRSALDRCTDVAIKMTVDGNAATNHDVRTTPLCTDELMELVSAPSADT
jgi:hypothetical protein